MQSISRTVSLSSREFCECQKVCAIILWYAHILAHGVRGGPVHRQRQYVPIALISLIIRTRLMGARWG